MSSPAPAARYMPARLLLISFGVLAVGFTVYAGQNPAATALLAKDLKTILTGIIFVSLAFLGAGYFVKKHPHTQVLRITGWVLFSLYWPFQGPSFFAEGDPFNGYACLLAPLFILYIAYHELRSLEWREDPAALRWVTGTTFVAAATYFLIYEVPIVQEYLIYFTAEQSVLMLQLVFGLPSHVLKDGAESHILLDGGPAGPEYAVTVILACTAIQSIMIFVGAIACLNADQRRKYRAYLYAVPVIYFLNLFRNAGIVYGYKVLEWNPFSWGGPNPGGWRGWFWIDMSHPFTGQFPGLAQGSFEWMHSWVGKYGSLLALIVIALAVFSVLPELHSHILDLFDLPKRRRAGYFDRDPPPPPESAPGLAIAPPTATSATNAPRRD
ncbi:MAG TPA: archaeosortase A [Candidatus Thermoplasmatota archaeon]|nr:archaeosortase A [Candidatus Thermoplasmatota archaeon]